MNASASTNPQDFPSPAPRGEASAMPALVSLLLGALAAAGFAPLALWPVTLVAVAAWLWLVHAAPTLRSALWRGWLFGWAHLTLADAWIPQAFTYQDAMPAWVGWPAIMLLAAYLAIYPALSAGIAWRVARARGTGPDGAFVLVAGAAWAIGEWARATLLTGYPWDPLAVIWVPVGAAHLAAWVGTYALSGLTVVLAGGLALAVQRRFVLFAVMTCVFVGGAVVGTPLPTTPWAPPPNYPHLLVVQPDLAEEQRPTDYYAIRNLTRLLKLTGKPNPDHPRLILWPEGALRFPLEEGYPEDVYRTLGDSRAVRAIIAHAIGPRDIVLTGAQAFMFDARDHMTGAGNSVFGVDAAARLRMRYDKGHLVPWGEYLPWRGVLTPLGLSRLVPGDIDFLPGPGPRSFDLPSFGRVGVDLCYEIIFSGAVVDRAHRPDLIFNPSNDSWYGDLGPAQHLAMARLRAIEEGLPIVRATPTGISAVIDTQGRVLASLPVGHTGAIELPMPGAAPPTPFARTGNAMVAIVAAALLLLALAVRRARR